ncbi:hypothetical protein MVEN_00137900 [Mycena venus]|uniref:Xylanolytic transcriptional activator regulatory domain-containing protein n=1 Tax=Mycena venus TaxID=2733690 RepID=A0A8H7DDK3_9AGAR|nr:hypothetical protein MVEN_00137900 [Mycena venus]
MIGPPPSSSYNTNDQQHHYQQQTYVPSQQHFDFSYSAPSATSYNDLLAQFYSQQQQPAQHLPHPGPQSTSNPSTAVTSSTSRTRTTANANPPVHASVPSVPKRQRATRNAAPAPQAFSAASAVYSDSDSDNGLGPLPGGGAGISVGMGGLGIRNKGARLDGQYVSSMPPGRARLHRRGKEAAEQVKFLWKARGWEASAKSRKEEAPYIISFSLLCHLDSCHSLSGTKALRLRRKRRGHVRLTRLPCGGCISVRRYGTFVCDLGPGSSGASPSIFVFFSGRAYSIVISVDETAPPFLVCLVIYILRSLVFPAVTPIPIIIFSFPCVVELGLTIRQKDAIIESLLKQLHNPYIATPLSIASYRMATPPSDATNRNILDCLDRLQASVGSGAASHANFAALSAKAKSTSLNSATPNFVSNPAFEELPDEDEAASQNEEEDEEDEVRESSTLPDLSVPLGLIANLSLSNNKSRKKRGVCNGESSSTRAEELDEVDGDNVGVANASYFMPGPATDLNMRAQLIAQHSLPEILIHGLVVPEDVDKLFEIFYTRINPFVSLLDPVMHTPASTFARCPFLFTVVCAVCSRYYPEKSEIYPIAMHFAKHSAATALIDGWKSVELCQAYILMSIYAVPARKWEEDRSWLYAGLAIRIATDLNLHQVPSRKAHKENEIQARELLNRTRVWMVCFTLDRLVATQFGKPATIKEDYILQHGGDDWYKESPYNSSYDIHVCCYVALLRLVAQFHDIFSGPALNKHVDLRTVTIAHDTKLACFIEEWGQRFAEGSDPNDPKCALRCKLCHFLVAYLRLVMFSFGFQHANQRGLQSQDHIFFTKACHELKALYLEGLAPTGLMRYAPDGHFIFATFASAFLLKLLRPEFSHLMVKGEENQVFDLIDRLIQTLSSPEIAIDDRHTPKLYASFLTGLLSKHRRDSAMIGQLHPPVQQSVTSSASSSKYGHMFGASSTFTMSPMGGMVASLPSEHRYGHVYAPLQEQTQPAEVITPIYQPEATYTGPIQCCSEFDFSTGLPDEEQMLAAMQELKNFSWWNNMMMPGYGIVFFP